MRTFTSNTTISFGRTWNVLSALSCLRLRPWGFPQIGKRADAAGLHRSTHGVYAKGTRGLDVLLPNSSGISDLADGGFHLHVAISAQFIHVTQTVQQTDSSTQRMYCDKNIRRDMTEKNHT